MKASPDFENSRRVVWSGIPMSDSGARHVPGVRSPWLEAVNTQIGSTTLRVLSGGESWFSVLPLCDMGGN
jgi:hypothetical protein